MQLPRKFILTGAAVLFAAGAALAAGGAGKKAGRPGKHEMISLRVSASQAVLGYLREPGKEKLDAALSRCLSVREKLPEDAFVGFLTAFCRHESGDGAGEEAILSGYPPVQRNMYRFFFYERRGELAETLYRLPAFLCKHLRELPSAVDAFRKGAICPSFGGPVVKETYTRGGKTGTRYLCRTCDAMIEELKKKGGALEPGGDEALCPILFHVAYKFLDSRWRFTSKEYDGVKGFISLLGVRDGETVADIGCGNGQFTFPIAEKVGPKGKVYAEEIDSRELELIKYCVEKGSITNIVPVLGTPTGVNLPADALDRAALVHVYRSILMGLVDDSPEQRDRFMDDFFSGVRAALKDGGELVLVDRIDPRFDVTAAKTAAALKKRGFRLVSDKSDLKDRTLILIFRKAAPGGK